MKNKIMLGSGPVCPRCFKPKVRRGVAREIISRRGRAIVCGECALEESLLDAGLLTPCQAVLSREARLRQVLDLSATTAIYVSAARGSHGK